MQDEFSLSSGSLGRSAFFEEYGASEASEILDPSQLDVVSNLSRFSNRHEHLSFKEREDPFPETSDEQFLCDNSSPTMVLEKYFGPDPTRGWEKLSQRTDTSSEENCKEVQCIETEVNPQNLNFSETPLSSGKGELYPEAESFVKVTEDETNMDRNVEFDSMEQSTCSSVTEMSNSSSTDDLSSTSCKEIRMTVPISPRSQIPEADENMPSTEVEKANLKGQEDGDKKLFEKSLENKSTDEKNLKDEMVKLKSNDKQFQNDLESSTDENNFKDEMVKLKSNDKQFQNDLVSVFLPCNTYIVNVCLQEIFFFLHETETFSLGSECRKNFNEAG